MSSGVPARPVGTIAPMVSMLGTFPTPAAFLAMGVSTMVGGMVLTVMPWPANSRAKAFVRPITPPFDAT